MEWIIGLIAGFGLTGHIMLRAHIREMQRQSAVERVALRMAEARIRELERQVKPTISTSASTRTVSAWFPAMNPDCLASIEFKNGEKVHAKDVFGNVFELKSKE